MFRLTCAITLLLFSISYAQPSTEVYLLDISNSNEGMTFSNFKNISNDPGYDSQPFFATNNLILFAGNNGGQTDIAQFDIQQNKKAWYHEGSSSSQYSPQRIPDSEVILAVHLDTNGRQRLFRHSTKDKTISEAHPTIQVAYFAMYDSEVMIGTVLGIEGLDLVVANLKTQSVDTMFYGGGRSFHKVPKSKMMSYTLVNEEGNHEIFQLDPKSFESFFVTQLPIGVQDHAWLSETTLILGSGDKLFVNDLFGDGKWQEVADLSVYKIKNITRLAVSPDGTKLVLVAEPN